MRKIPARKLVLLLLLPIFLLLNACIKDCETVQMTGKGEISVGCKEIQVLNRLSCDENQILYVGRFGLFREKVDYHIYRTSVDEWECAEFSHDTEIPKKEVVDCSSKFKRLMTIAAKATSKKTEDGGHCIVRYQIPRFVF